MFFRKPIETGVDYNEHPIQQRLMGSFEQVTFFLSGVIILLSMFISFPAHAILEGISYVPITDENQVYVINTAEHKVLKKITVGMHPIVVRALPDRSKIYVDNFGPLGNQISVIDTKTNTVIKTIYTNGAPYASMELTKNGRYLYVPTDFSVVHVIDTQTDTIVKTFGVSLLPAGIQLSPDDKTLYVFYPSTVAAYSAENGSRTKPMLLVDGFAPGWAAITADGKKMYAINALSSNITTIDIEAWKVTKSIFQPLTALPLSGTLTPDGKKLYICNIGTYNMTIIDTATDTIEKVIPTLYTPIYVSFNASGTEAYLSNLGPLTNLPPLARPILFDFFYFLPPGLPGNIATYDVVSGKQKGVTVTGNGPVVGVYF